MNTKHFLNLLAREPYRLFFPLGILIGMFGVSHWLFYALGWTENYSNTFHASIQMQGYMSCFIIGFLLTAMPRFASAPSASKRELFSFLVLTLGIAVFLQLGWFAAADILFICWLLAILRFAAVRFLNRRDKKIMPPTEFVWIPIGIFHGILGSLLLVVGKLFSCPAWVVLVGKPMMLQGFLFSVVVGVGGFLGPRLMGVQQLISPDNIKKEAACAPAAMEIIRKQRIAMHLIAGLILFLTFWLEGIGLKMAAYALRAVVVTGEFLFTGVLPGPPRVKSIFSFMLWISFLMVALGSWGEFFFPDYRVIMLHFIFLGGFSLMTFAVGTVVVLSHAGEGGKLYRPLPVLWLVLICVLGSLALRVSADWFPVEYFDLLGKAAVIWLIGALSWLLFILPKVFRVPDEGTFEREHEKAKTC